MQFRVFPKYRIHFQEARYILGFFGVLWDTSFDVLTGIRKGRDKEKLSRKGSNKRLHPYKVVDISDTLLLQPSTDALFAAMR